MPIDQATIFFLLTLLGLVFVGIIFMVEAFTIFTTLYKILTKKKV